MNDKQTNQANLQQDEALRTWIKQRMARAVEEFTDQGLVSEMLVEARPAWVFPYTLLIGRIRDRGRTDGFDWFICGDGPTTHVQSSKAPTPREAARHFALQWQLQAAKQGGMEGDELAQKAGALYELVEQPALWFDYG